MRDDDMAQLVDDAQARDLLDAAFDWAMKLAADKKDVGEFCKIARVIRDFAELDLKTIKARRPTIEERRAAIAHASPTRENVDLVRIRSLLLSYDGGSID